MEKKVFETLFIPVLEQISYELTDIKLANQNKKLLIQVFIDHANATGNDANGGITFDDCEKASSALGKCLDEKMPNLDGYLLEVSSPGMDRVLKKEKDFNRFAGSTVKIKLKKPLDGTKVFYGEILNCENGTLHLAGGLSFSLTDTEEIRLHYSDEEIFKKR